MTTSHYYGKLLRGIGVAADAERRSKATQQVHAHENSETTQSDGTLPPSAAAMPTEVPPTRTRRPESRRQELLDAALRVYLARGTVDSTVADVTEEAGAAKGTFYRYFPSKDHLLLALREQFTEELLTTIEDNVKAVAPQGHWAELEALCRSLLDFGREKMQVHNLLFHTPGGFSVPEGETDPFETRILEWLTGFIRAGAESGSFQVDDPELVALLFFSALHRGTERATQVAAISHDRLVDAVVEMMTRTFGGACRPRDGSGRPTVVAR